MARRGGDRKNRDKKNIAEKNKYEERVLLRFTDEFWKILDKMRKTDIPWAVSELELNPTAKNTLKIEWVDVSDQKNILKIKKAGQKDYTRMRVYAFIKAFFGDTYEPGEIDAFVDLYNSSLPNAKDDDTGIRSKTGANYSGGVTNYRNYNGGTNYQNYGKKTAEKPTYNYEYIEHADFEYDPKNVRGTFLSLVQETYPHGHEEEVVKFLPKDLKKDRFGNYYKVIGDSDTVFTCHLDTASRTKSRVNLISYKKGTDEFIITDRTSILGADDKAGVAVMMYMMAHDVPGVYWFFIGEERGGIGSGKVASDIDSYEFMNQKKKVVSFDRRNYFSVITKQMGVDCCSNTFATSLCEELNKHGMNLNLDDTGVFTDSANFIDYIPECTNISVGYFNEHTHDEIQNITYLEKLAKACVAIDWSILKVERKVEMDDVVMKKYSGLVRAFKKAYFYNVDNIKGFEDKVVMELQVVDGNPDFLSRDLSRLDMLIYDHITKKGMRYPKVKFNGNIIKIEVTGEETPKGGMLPNFDRGHFRSFESLNDDDEISDDERIEFGYGGYNPTQSDEDDQVCSSIRKTLRANGFENFYVSSASDEYMAEVVLNSVEEMRVLMRLLNTMSKLQSSTLSGHDYTVDLWETKEKRPIFTFDFFRKTAKKILPDEEEWEEDDYGLGTRSTVNTTNFKQSGVKDDFVDWLDSKTKPDDLPF